MLACCWFCLPYHVATLSAATTIPPHIPFCIRCRYAIAVLLVTRLYFLFHCYKILLCTSWFCPSYPFSPVEDSYDYSPTTMVPRSIYDQPNLYFAALVPMQTKATLCCLLQPVDTAFGHCMICAGAFGGQVSATGAQPAFQCHHHSQGRLHHTWQACTAVSQAQEGNGSQRPSCKCHHVQVVGTRGIKTSLLLCSRFVPPVHSSPPLPLSQLGSPCHPVSLSYPINCSRLVSILLFVSQILGYDDCVATPPSVWLSRTLFGSQ